jgi:phosphate transport system substrate-binding protein
MKRMMMGMISVVIGAGMVFAGDPNKIVVDGSTTVGPIAKAFAEYAMQKNPVMNITVSESGSGNGAKSLLNNACDVATMSRPMKNSEKKAAQEAGILAFETVVAMDGLAMIVHESNPVQGLTLEQIRAIYSGQIVNWKELGGPDQPIVLISRDTNSGTYESFETLAMKGAKIGSKAEYVGSNGAIRQRVVSTPAAIGYVGLAFCEGVKVLAVNQVMPSDETVLNKSYPISRPLFMYTNGRPKAGTAKGDFVLLGNTPEGRKIIEDVGYIPVQ